MHVKQPTVAVLMGGIGSERSVSLESGASVVRALVEAGVPAMGWDVGPDRLDVLDSRSVDVFFVAMHGEFGEDGRLQRIIEDRGLCHTGSGPEACEAAFDKCQSKRLFERAGVPTAPWLLFEEGMETREFERRAAALGPKVVVKPLRQGSSVGVSILENRPARVLDVCLDTARQFGHCMVEQFVAGREVTVGILCDSVLPVIEIRPAAGFYDYQAKYVSEQTQFLFDTLDKTLERTVREVALDCYQALGLRHMARVDLMASEQGCFVLEANAIPGLTSHSLLPKAAARVGLSMSDLCIRVVEAAYEQHRL